MQIFHARPLWRRLMHTDVCTVSCARMLGSMASRSRMLAIAFIITAPLPRGTRTVLRSLAMPCGVLAYARQAPCCLSVGEHMCLIRVLGSTGANVKWQPCFFRRRRQCRSRKHGEPYESKQ